VNNLVVDSEFLALVTDDENTNATAAVIKGVGETVEQIALVDDRKTLLHIAGLRHGNDTSIITDVKNTVLLEDWAQHVLDNDRRGWI